MCAAEGAEGWGLQKMFHVIQRLNTHLCGGPETEEVCLSGKTTASANTDRGPWADPAMGWTTFPWLQSGA